MRMIYGLGIYLGMNSILDIWKKRISLLSSVLFSVIGIACHMGQTGIKADLLWSVSPGLALIGLAILTEQKIGVGDGIVILVCGVFLGIRETMFLTMLSLILSAVAGMGLIAARKGSMATQLPWVPFVFAAFVLMCTVFR